MLRKQVAHQAEVFKGHVGTLGSSLGEVARVVGPLKASGAPVEEVIEGLFCDHLELIWVCPSNAL